MKIIIVAVTLAMFLSGCGDGSWLGVFGVR